MRALLAAALCVCPGGVVVRPKTPPERLKQKRAVAGKAKTFRTLKGFLGRYADSHAPVTYQEAAEALGVGVSNVTSLI